jgi:Ca2+-binding EF-hand superfamily protein
MKTLTTTFAVGLTIAAAGLALPVLGQPMGGPMGFAQFDRNQDGVVTEQEFAEARAERMGSRAAQGAPMRGIADAPSFADFDRNGDGRLTPDEVTALQQERRQGRAGMGAGPGMGQGMGRGMGANLPSFGQFDLDGDGVLTEQEFNEARGQRIQQRAQQGYGMRNLANAPAFQAIDVDGDGRVTAEEFAAAQAEHRQQMMAPR